jgi:hypothetical protein
MWCHDSNMYADPLSPLFNIISICWFIIKFLTMVVEIF